MIKEIGEENFWAKLCVQNVVVSYVIMYQEKNLGLGQEYRRKKMADCINEYCVNPACDCDPCECTAESHCVCCEGYDGHK